MMKTAWVFPGQGSQVVGMGMDLLELPAAKERLEWASNVLGWSVIEVCQGPEDRLAKTFYTQPCLYLIESLLVDLLMTEGYTPNWVAGHSLGEYVAFYAAGVFSFESGLRLVKRRAELMDAASDGKMVALVGFERAELEAAIDQTPGVILANDNNPGQVVISGTVEAVDTVVSAIKVRKAIPLNVSGAFHSPLMADAAAEFQLVLDLVSFNDAKIPVLSNVEPTATTDAHVLRDRLTRQMTGPVRWREISLHLAANGVERVVEIGPGKVLTGLVKRTCPELVLENISNFTDLKAWIASQ
ncbi:MAG: ACP S-malonyltransferase [Cyanobacteria bacterium]|nr:ACP S-malonyltransferase [Cyanobacteriota bacterium]MDW8201984.1 ACP S-malonyltransferase [Cyanobacteriota bacterium SKYGB_h_bin112]